MPVTYLVGSADTVSDAALVCGFELSELPDDVATRCAGLLAIGVDMQLPPDVGGGHV